MKIENQVCNESQSRALKDLGIKYKDYQFAFVEFGVPSGQETVLCRPATETEEFHKEWAWFLIGKHSKEIREEIDEGTLGADGGVYPAFTVAELGCMLALSSDGVLPIKFNTPEFNLWFEGMTDYCKSEAALRSSVLIHLLENNLITSDEVNQRLQSK